MYRYIAQLCEGVIICTLCSIAIAIPWEFSLKRLSRPSPRLNLDLPRSPRVIAHCLYCCFAQASVSVLLDLQLACKFELTTSLLVVKFKWRLAETTNSSHGCFFPSLLSRNDFFSWCIKLEYAHGTPQCCDENRSAGPWRYLGIRAFVDRRRGFTATRIIIGIYTDRNIP